MFGVINKFVEFQISNFLTKKGLCHAYNFSEPLLFRKPLCKNGAALSFSFKTLVIERFRKSICCKTAFTIFKDSDGEFLFWKYNLTRK